MLPYAVATTRLHADLVGRRRAPTAARRGTRRGARRPDRSSSGWSAAPACSVKPTRLRHGRPAAAPAGGCCRSRRARRPRRSRARSDAARRVRRRSSGPRPRRRAARRRPTSTRPSPSPLTISAWSVDSRPHDLGRMRRPGTPRPARPVACRRRRREADLVGVARRQRELSTAVRSPSACRARARPRAPRRGLRAARGRSARSGCRCARRRRRRPSGARARPGRRIGDAVLQAAVDRVEEIGGAGCAVRDQLARDVGPIGEAGRDRVDGVAPRVRREVGARLLEDAGLVVARVRARRSPASSTPAASRSRCRFLP